MTESPNANMPAISPEATLARLINIMARLRNPESGCPWDIAQTFRSIAPYTVEEAYEVADAISRNDISDLKEELGDLLLQVVFHARMAEELGEFSFADVATAISDKMERRHPHVFGDDKTINDSSGQTMAWEAQKEEERRTKADRNGKASSLLDGIATNLPSVTRALKLQKRAATIGFDWDNLDPVLEKIDEELHELRTELSRNGSKDHLEAELGDLMFAVVNLARHLALDPESALRRTNEKFEQRFKFIERSLENAGMRLADASLTDLENRWQEAKKTEL
ncbi:nucleoside triphosphate pyrophosphohydrolase [Limibacillus halophilus]|uniref:Nucleoside triphosphate pyrophosphohydrolase n=1 Tax=Limibacillus halophilus TaxID=1579333 RepID=A0A839SVD8_9PROT|nr:nucleoside triphosphate pyrophosphohydrolase [Limibacillus halophilus]MBB3065650.1 MazG family protein [Limibacillus halophilus]